MNIQPINVNSDHNVGFGKLVVQKGSFEKLKTLEYFPQENTLDYHEHLKAFYRQLMELKKKCADNNVYDVVIKPEKNSINSNGKVVIENAANRREQFGFSTTFEDLLYVSSDTPKDYLTKANEPNTLIRTFKNWNIKRQNKNIKQKQIGMKEFLNIVYKRIEIIAQNADYLMELHNLKNK